MGVNSIYSMTTISKISVNFSPQNNTCIISLLNTSKVVRVVQSLIYWSDSVLRKSFRLFTICNSSKQNFPLFEQDPRALESLDGS